MSTTTRPVTQTDVVAVNSAVRTLVFSPGALDIGSMRSSVPIIIVKRKLTGMKRSGVIRIRLMRALVFFIVSILL